MTHQRKWFSNTVDSQAEADHSDTSRTLPNTDQTLLHYKISIHMNVTLSLHAKLSLSRDCHYKSPVNQRLFFFHRVCQGKVHVIFSTWPYFRESVCWNYFGVGFYMESLVIVTFLFSQCVESHMVTRVPSPTISIAKRTALCPPMDSLRKQSTRGSLGNKPFSGLCTWQCKTRLRVTALRPLSVLCWTNQRYFDV